MTKKEWQVGATYYARVEGSISECIQFASLYLERYPYNPFETRVKFDLENPDFECIAHLERYGCE
jgi:hypothetical protein